ncbi:MAG: flavodoxin [Candidatus Saccharibacteria bacterium]|nr:flavodoxin [Candidatus Saccharibacteria bacterium]
MQDKKILVVYFSKADENYNVGEIEVGNTELLAEEIIKRTGADEFKIEPKAPYPKGYQETVDLATEEKASDARPEYLNEIDIKKYDTIFLGYPIWWGDLPMIVYTFLDNHDFSNKTVIPFNTHEGSGNAGTYEDLKVELPESNVIGDGFNMTGMSARTEEGIKKLNDWLSALGF